MARRRKEGRKEEGCKTEFLLECLFFFILFSSERQNRGKVYLWEREKTENFPALSDTDFCLRMDLVWQREEENRVLLWLFFRRAVQVGRSPKLIQTSRLTCEVRCLDIAGDSAAPYLVLESARRDFS